jgi:hypothetical protein
MNKGLTGREIAEIVRLPPHLANHPYLIGKCTKNVFFYLWTNHQLNSKSKNKSLTVLKIIYFVINFFYFRVLRDCGMVSEGSISRLHGLVQCQVRLARKNGIAKKADKKTLLIWVWPVSYIKIHIGHT